MPDWVEVEPHDLVEAARDGVLKRKLVAVQLQQLFNFSTTGFARVSS